MSVELQTIINSSLFKSTTDGLSGTGALKYSGNTLAWTPDVAPESKAYASLGASNAETFTLVADTPIDLTSATLWASGVSTNFTIDNTAGELLADVAGVYTISAWASIASDTINTTVTLRYVLNGTASPTGLVGTSKDAGDTKALSADSLIALAQNDVISLEIKADKNCVLTVKSAGFTLHKIDEV